MVYITVLKCVSSNPSKPAQRKPGCSPAHERCRCVSRSLWMQNIIKLPSIVCCVQCTWWELGGRRGSTAIWSKLIRSIWWYRLLKSVVQSSCTTKSFGAYQAEQGLHIFCNTLSIACTRLDWSIKLNEVSPRSLHEYAVRFVCWHTLYLMEIRGTKLFFISFLGISALFHGDSRERQKRGSGDREGMTCSSELCTRFEPRLLLSFDPLVRSFLPTLPIFLGDFRLSLRSPSFLPWLQSSCFLTNVPIF